MLEWIYIFFLTELKFLQAYFTALKCKNRPDSDEYSEQTRSKLCESGMKKKWFALFLDHTGPCTCMTALCHTRHRNMFDNNKTLLKDLTEDSVHCAILYMTNLNSVFTPTD